MISPDSQAAARSQISVATVLLSSSVVLAAMTGVLYLVGGAYFEGYWQALGLNYLAGHQPTEYIFAGAELLLVSAYVVVSVFAVMLAFFGMEFLALVKGKRIPRKMELFIFVAVVSVSSFLIFVVTLLKINGSRNLIVSGACPVMSRGPTVMILFLLLCGAVLVACFGFSFFEPRLFRLTYLVWGIIASIFCLYGFGRASGALELYQSFRIMEVGSTSLSLPAKARLLVLGSDDKYLVVLSPGVNRAGHAEPTYLLRSEINSFSIVGAASINDFVCNASARPSSPAGH